MLDGGDFGGALRGMINAPARRRRRDPRGRLLHPIWRLRRRASARPAARMSMTATASAAASPSGSSRRTASPSRRASSIRRSARTASTGRRCTTSIPTRSPTRRAPMTSASNICCCARASRTTRFSPTSTSASISATSTLTSIITYINRDIVVSRDASALTGSVSVDLGYPAAAVNLPSNLVDTTDLETFTQEFRLATNSEGRSMAARRLLFATPTASTASACPPRAMTPSPTPRFGAGTAAARGERLPAQFALQCGPALRHRPICAVRRGDLGRLSQLHLTAGGRYYDFSRDAQFISGGLFSNGDNRIDETIVQRLQPALHPELRGGRQYPHQRPGVEGLPARRRQRSAQHPALHGRRDGDALTYGNRPTYEDETLWNYEVGVRGRRSGLNFAAAAFYTDIRNLQVTPMPAPARRASSSTCPSAHTHGHRGGALLRRRSRA